MYHGRSISLTCWLVAKRRFSLRGEGAGERARAARSDRETVRVSRASASNTHHICSVDATAFGFVVTTMASLTAGVIAVCILVAGENLRELADKPLPEAQCTALLLVLYARVDILRSEESLVCASSDDAAFA